MGDSEDDWFSDPDLIWRVRHHSDDVHPVPCNFDFPYSHSGSYFDWCEMMLEDVKFFESLTTTGVYSFIILSWQAKFHSDHRALCRLVKRWCKDTYTFFMEFGEITIMLKDAMVITLLPLLGSHDPRNIFLSANEKKTCSAI
ncbi:hypothetical protein REPUB_Repub03eG0118100 [Reevesia pubescens]